MINALKTFRTQSPALIFSPPSNFGRKVSGVRFKQATTLHSSGPESESESNTDMDNKAQNNPTQNNPPEKTGDVLSHSFGEGYATRCDDDGFGGTCGGNQSVTKTEQGQLIHENHPAYDKSQGSEVKEKEKARHQTSCS